MQKYKEKFIEHYKIKEKPNDFEIELFEKTQKYIKKISWIPGLKMVAVGNTLSMYCTKSTSDIDLFVVTAKNRAWLVRFLVTIIFYTFGVWRKGEENSAKNFCLSFFIDENNLDFSKIAIENDIYLFYWIYYLKPILDIDNTYEKFIEENKTLKIDKNNLPKDNLNYLLKNKKTSLSIFSYFSFILDFIDWFGYFFYMKVFKFLSPKTKKVQRPFGVIITREILKFHDTDKRLEIRDNLIEK